MKAKGAEMETRLLFLVLLLVLGLGLQPAQGQEDLFRKGKDVFENNCADCYRFNGRGLPGTFPAHDGNPFVTGAPGPVIATMLNGRKGQPGQMPTWKDKLNDEQIAAVVTYIRHAWSHKAPGVTPALAAKTKEER